MTMNSFLDQYIRLNDRVVKLDDTSASCYRRVRAESFEQVAFFPLKNHQPLDVVRMAAKSFSSNIDIDILIDEQISVVGVSNENLFKGWRISAKHGLVEVVVSDIFANRVVTLSIELTVILEAAEYVHQSGVPNGRIFFSSPSQDFRYSVFCPLGRLRSVEDVLSQCGVGLSVAFPRFDELTDTSLKIPVAQRPRPAQKSIDITPQARIERPGKKRNFLFGRYFSKRDAEMEVLVGQLPYFSRPGVGASASENVTSDVNRPESVLNAEDVTGTLISLRLPVESAVKAEFTPLDASIDAVLCVLLDGKADTAIAAAAFLARQAQSAEVLVEIGLWRRKFKSVFSDFATITNTFELVRLPMSETEKNNLSTFLGALNDGDADKAPVIVIGEELLDAKSLHDFNEVLATCFPRTKLIVFGQGNLAVSAHWRGLAHLVNGAVDHAVVLGEEPTADVIALFGKRSDSHRYYLPPYRKQSILALNKTGNASHIVREMAHHIYPD